MNWATAEAVTQVVTARHKFRKLISTYSSVKGCMPARIAETKEAGPIASPNVEASFVLLLLEYFCNSCISIPNTNAMTQRAPNKRG